MRLLAYAASIAVALAQVAAAEDAPELPSYTAKRVLPPAAGAARRINVQIDPEEQARYIAALPSYPDPHARRPVATGPDADPNAATAYPWFWQAVSPGMSAGSAGRLQAALSGLTQGPQGEVVPMPRMQAMQDIAERYASEILKATVGTKVSPALVLAVIGIESAGRESAVSNKGATGLMQLMPATAARFGVTDISDPAQNIRGGVAYLDWLMREFGDDPVLVLAGYNAGEGAVRDNGGVPPYRETRDYVPKVLAAWTVARGLCATPPELLSDGCVFRVRSAGL